MITGHTPSGKICTLQHCWHIGSICLKLKQKHETIHKECKFLFPDVKKQVPCCWQSSPPSHSSALHGFSSHSQLWANNVKWKLPKINNSWVLNCMQFWVVWWNLASPSPFSSGCESFLCPASSQWADSHPLLTE